jgi:ribose 5-phosphate isomerase B
MSEENDQTRERVRALVREVLEKFPAEAEAEPPKQFPERVVVNSLREEVRKEFDRDESAKSLITEDDLRGLERGAKLRVAEDVKFTPLALDLIHEKQFQLIPKSSRAGTLKVKSVAIGADHGGFELKEQLKNFLAELGIRLQDFGTNSKDAVDYPDYALAVAKAVGEGRLDAGIMIDGAGIGSAMAANKVPNVRAAACYNVALAQNSREHNGANVLTLGSGQTSFSDAKEIVRAFLTTEISEERHKKRVAKIDAIANQFSK